MYSTDAATGPQEVSKENIVKNNIGIRNLHVDDLFYLEQDLDFYEKVSLVFLLYGNDRDQYKRILQQLVALSLEPTKQTDLMRTWAKDKTDWRNTFLEALCLIQAKCAIHKLGLDPTELNQRYLPANRYIKSHIHLIVKLLHYVCEELTVKQSKQLINYMAHKYPSVRNFMYTGDGEYLEIHLIHWLLEGVIDIGQTNNNIHSNNGGASNLPCNLEPIIQWLKQAELDTLRELIKNVTNKFNGQTTPKPAATPMTMVQTDDKQATAVQETAKTFDSLRMNSTDPNNVYKIRSKSAGLMLIINQKRFRFDTNPELKQLLPRHKLEERLGTDRDALALEDVFKRFGYRVRVEENRLHSEILNDVRDVVNESVGYDSVIVCILSHGCKGIVYGSNSIPVKIEDIEKLIISERLIGKPKILIVQACQGEQTQQAKEIEYLRHDGPKSSLPVYSDFLTCISTVPGYTSIRHIQKGSWFIQTLCEKVREFSKRKHLLEILTMVIREVQEKRGRDDECMVPIFNSTFGLDLYFPSTD